MSVPPVVIFELRRKNRLPIEISEEIKINKIETINADLPTENQLQEEIDKQTSGLCLDYKLSSIICKKHESYYILAKK